MTSANSAQQKERKEAPKPDRAAIVQCKVCGAALPRGAKRCAICGTQRGRYTPLHPPTPEPEKKSRRKRDSSPHSFRKNRIRMGRTALILALFMLVSGFTVGLYEYVSFQNLLARYNLQGAILYQQGSNSLNLSLGTMSETINLTKRFQSSTTTLTAKASPDSRFLGYFNNQRSSPEGVSGTFFLLDTLDLRPDSEQNPQGLEVTEQPVLDFYFLPSSDQLIYLTTNGDLYLYDYRGHTRVFGSGEVTETLLDTEVKGIGTLFDTQMLYYKGKNATSNTYDSNQVSHTGSSFDLYKLQLMDREAVPTLIAKNIYSVLDVTKSLDRIFYTKRTHSPPLVQYEIYEYEEYERDTETSDTFIASNVWHVVSANATKEELLYLSPQQNMIRFEDIIDDDLAKQDEISRQQAQRLAGEEGQELVEQSPEEILEEFAQQAESSDAPDTPMTEEEQRRLRDQFRAYLRSSIRDEKQEQYLCFDLYEYQGSQQENIKLGGPIYNWDSPDKLVTLDRENQAAVFVESNPDNIVKDRISEFTSADIELFLQTPFELLPYLAEQLPDSLCYLSLQTGEVQKPFAEPGTRVISQFSIPAGQNDVFFISYPSYDSTTGTLYQVPIQQGIADKVIYLDEDVESVIGILQGDSSGLVYQTASRDDPPQRNLYYSSNSTILEIASDTSTAEHVKIIGAEQNALTFFRDFNPLSQTGDLFFYYDGTEHFVAANVSGITTERSKGFFLIKREASSFRSLYEYRDGELVLLDKRLGGYVMFDKKET